ncbi:AC3 [Insect-associated begomovirus 4]|nr:AC3 [Insect-associated begomovirus 4]
MTAPMDFRTEEPITEEQAELSVPTATLHNPLYFKILWFHRFSTVYQLQIQIRFNHNLRKSLKIHKCWINLTLTGIHRTLTGNRFSNLLHKRLIRYLTMVGSISLNNVIRGLRFVLYDEFNFVSSVIQDQSIAMNLY